ncbi:uncharacterized protein LOC126681612 [Mercurialis annua]|uniref:uncharacterized protein LOC126681612 n=1 Tax=Mercurialis annua TaxID=3986 RepID=UPI002160C02B|nr:uncharacterized protein LOC126681612 [Mercurialis annua]
MLSYDGRVQLIQYVLLSMHVFWASTLILPKSVTKEIQNICSRFLWSGNVEGKNKALVAWKEVIKLKKEGGLNIKDIEVWNRAAVSKHVWQIIENTNNLWAKWISTNKIKNGNYWSNKSDNNSSWVWKGLMSIKKEIMKIVEFKIGNANNINFWKDHPWIHGCFLLEKYPRVMMKEAAVLKNSKVADLWRHNRWNLPDPIGMPTLEACEYIKENFTLNNDNDTISWKVVKGSNFNPEDINHIFYGCSFTKMIWNKLLLICGCPRNISSWRRFISWFCKIAIGKNANAAIRRNIMTATIYQIWRSRNMKVFKNETPVVEENIRRFKFIILSKMNRDCLHLVSLCCYGFGFNSPEAFVTGKLQPFPSLLACGLSIWPEAFVTGFCSRIPEAFVTGFSSLLSSCFLIPL